jgi:hypothetical protein
MYLKKSRGESHLTQTYAATGGACAARLLYNTNAHLLDDLEPWATHDQIIGDERCRARTTHVACHGERAHCRGVGRSRWHVL